MPPSGNSAQTDRAGFRALELRLEHLAFEVNDAVRQSDVDSLPVPEYEYRLEPVLDKRAKTIDVRATVKTTGEVRDNPFTLSATVVAHFDYDDGTSLPPEEFAKRNAAAFCWPYLRELVWSMTVRSGYPALMLRILNLGPGVQVEVRGEEQ